MFFVPELMSETPKSGDVHTQIENRVSFTCVSTREQVRGGGCLSSVPRHLAFTLGKLAAQYFLQRIVQVRLWRNTDSSGCGNFGFRFCLQLTRQATGNNYVLHSVVTNRRLLDLALLVWTDRTLQNCLCLSFKESLQKRRKTELVSVARGTGGKKCPRRFSSRAKGMHRCGKLFAQCKLAAITSIN